MTDYLNRIPTWARWVLYALIPYLTGRLLVSIVAFPLRYIQGPDSLLSIAATILFELLIVLIMTLCIGCLAYILAPSSKFAAVMVQLVAWDSFRIKNQIDYIASAITGGNTQILYSWISILSYFCLAAIIYASILIGKNAYRREKHLTGSVEL
jgi:hypothetical protein